MSSTTDSIIVEATVAEEAEDHPDLRVFAGWIVSPDRLFPFRQGLMLT